MSFIAAANNYYRYSRATPQRIHVDDETSRRFSQHVRSLIKALKGESESSAWDHISRLANAARWRGTYDPVPFDNKASTTAPLLAELVLVSGRLWHSAPAHLQLLLSSVRSAAEAYLARGNYPFASAVTRMLEGEGHRQTLIVVRNRRTATAVKKWFKENGIQHGHILVPGEYIRNPISQRAAFCGPSFVFPPQLLTSNRASEIRLIHHYWIREDDKIFGLFGQHATVPLATHIREPERPTANWQPWSGTDASDLAVKPDWAAVAASAPRTSATHTEMVDARLVVLSGNHALWLPSEGERIRAIDPSAPPKERVISLPVSMVTQGTILLLRSGVSDAATTRGVAYALLGAEKAAEVQQLQAHWKRRLRRALDQQGPGELTKKLRSLNVPVHNITYWAGDELIQPRNIEHFKVLLRLLGINQPGPYIKAGHTLRKAVALAGHRLTEALESKVSDGDLGQIEVNGMLELQLDDLPGAAPMTAYQVIAIRDEVSKVAAHDCRRPFVTRGVEWLE